MAVDVCFLADCCWVFVVKMAREATPGTSIAFRCSGIAGLNFVVMALFWWLLLCMWLSGL